MLHFVARAFFLLFFLSWLTAPGQTCPNIFQGKVVDEKGDALIGANVWIESIRSGAQSSTDGSFTIRNLCTGKYTLQISFVGYQSLTLDMMIPSTQPLLIALKPASTLLHDVLVEGEHVRQHGASQVANALSSDDLRSKQGKTLGEMIQSMPGVTSLMTGPTIFKPMIHGLHSQRVLILNNGIRQEGQQWGIEHAPEIDPYIASEIEVVKGAEAVRYGSDAIGGVVIINPEPLQEITKFGVDLSAGFTTNNRGGAFSTKFEGKVIGSDYWKWRLQGTVKRGGDYHAPNYNLSNTGSSELDFSAGIGFKKDKQSLEVYASGFNTELGILRSAHTGNLEDLENSIESGQPWYIGDFTYTINNPRQKIGHYLLKMKASQNLTEDLKLNVLYGGQYNQRKEYDVRRGGRSDTPALSLELFSHVVDISLDRTGDKWSGSIGINGTLRDNTNVPGTGIQPLIPDYNLLSGGLFVLEKYRLPSWILEGGLRFDHQYLEVLTFDRQDNLLTPSFNFNYWSGTLGATYFTTHHLQFLTNLGISSRPPHVSELFSQGLHHGTASIEEGLITQHGDWYTNLPTVKKEVSFKWLNTLQYEKDEVSFEFTVYANMMYNYIYLQPTDLRLTIRGFFPVFQYRQTKAFIGGADANVTLNISQSWTYTGKLSYLYAADLTNDDKLPFMPPLQIGNGVKYSFRTTSHIRQPYVSLTVPIVFKQYRAPMTVHPEDVPAYDGDKNFDFMDAPDGYVLFNLEMGGYVPLGKRELSIVLSGENLLNTSYRNYMNRLRYYADDVGLNVAVRLQYRL